uniref:Uncharacterized protein n=1 Tax=Anas zonorhyncha TaxID=75864 RepID=A0A8B9ZUB7_9AVES
MSPSATCIYPNPPGAITRPSSAMRACSSRLTATTTPKPAASTSLEPWMTFLKSQRRASSSYTPALTTPPEWIPGRSSGRRWQPR